jgi:transposase
MARALGEDLRLRVLKAADEGASARQAAARFGVGVSSAIRWIARAKIGELMPRQQGRRCGSRLRAAICVVVAPRSRRASAQLLSRYKKASAATVASVRKFEAGRGLSLSDFGMLICGPSSAAIDCYDRGPPPAAL